MAEGHNFFYQLAIEGFGPAIGAFFGFVFGWLLHELQEGRKRKRAQHRLSERRLFELRALSAVLWTTVNEVLITKSQSGVDLKRETEGIKQAYGSWQPNSVPVALIGALESASTFFQSFEEVNRDIGAELDKVGFVAVDRIEVVQIIADLKLSLRALDNFTRQRNTMLERYASAAIAAPLSL